MLCYRPDETLWDEICPPITPWTAHTQQDWLFQHVGTRRRRVRHGSRDTALPCPGQGAAVSGARPRRVRGEAGRPASEKPGTFALKAMCRRSQPGTRDRQTCVRPAALIVHNRQIRHHFTGIQTEYFITLTERFRPGATHPTTQTRGFSPLLTD